MTDTLASCEHVWKRVCAVIARRGWMILATALVGLLAGWIVYLGKLTSPEYLVTHLPDDAFYYFQIAKNIAHGRGSTFDGVVPTNGYHPLWMILITPLFALFSDPLKAVHASLVLGGLFFLASLGVFAIFLKRLGVPRLGILLLSLAWVANPFTRYFALNGLETSLAILCLLSLLLHAYTYASRERVTRKQSIWLGVLAGLSILTRIDYVIYVACTFLWYLMRRSAPLKQKIKEVALSSVIIGFMILPWFAWNGWKFGSFIQTSGTTYTVIQRSLVEYANAHIHPLVRFAKASFSKTIEGLGMLLRVSGLGAAVLFILGYVFGYRSHETGFSPSSEDAKRRRMHVWLFVAPMLLYFLANITYRWAARDWYAAHFFPLVLLALAPSFVSIWNHFSVKERRREGMALAAILCLSLMAGYGWYRFKYLRTSFPAQASMLASARWIDGSLPPGQTIGVFNSGIVGFFTQNHRIVNIDGIVNNDAGKHLRTHTLPVYLREQNIGYVMDYENIVLFKYAIVGWWGNPEKDLVYKETMPQPTISPLPMKLYQVR